MKMFNKIAIIGVGEIGGSIGLACRGKLAGRVTGICRRESSASKARKAGAVDETTLSMKKGVKGAGLIILAAPVGKIVVLGKKAALYAEKGALITDVGSTKKYIVESMEKDLPRKVNFVGSHPMAGSEKGGPLCATGDLFRGRDCFVTRTQKTNKRALDRVKKFWRFLGAKPIEVSVSEHDIMAAKISQMIHIAASALVLAAGGALKYAASGFRDTTRIALSDPGLWKDICVTNNRDIVRSLTEYVKVLKSFSVAISQKDASRIRAMLERAKKLRMKIK